HDGATLEDLLKNVNEALYKAKKENQGQYLFFTDSHNHEAYEHTQLKQALELALKDEALTLHYQPKYHLQTSHIIGVDALMRFEHPTLGVIPPIKFISVAEESGLLTPLT